MKTKKIKVVYTTRYLQNGSRSVPKIQMEGNWLEALGFSIGSTIIIEYEEGSIRIRPMTEEELYTLRQNEIAKEIHLKNNELHKLHSDYSDLLKVAESSQYYNK